MWPPVGWGFDFNKKDTFECYQLLEPIAKKKKKKILHIYWNLEYKKILGEVFMGDPGRLERILHEKLGVSNSSPGFDISTDDFHLSITVFAFINWYIKSV